MALPPLLEEISPETIGEDRIDLRLDDGILQPRAGQVVVVNIDYSRCAPEGIALPLELVVQTPSATGFTRRFFTRTKPTSITFRPREGGGHLVLLRELYHHHWFGRLRVKVIGDRASPPPLA
jgi:hypothetical protein